MVTSYNGPAAKLFTPPTLTLVKMTITNHNMVEDKFGGRGFIDQDLRIAEKFYLRGRGSKVDHNYFFGGRGISTI